nr:hypothetical protein [uncultured Psychroserpens sp.]
MNTSSQITQILKTVKSFKVVQCQMHHEKVVVDTHGKPMFNSIENALVFKRVNLCKAAIRQKRLGCAHSSSNLNFEYILDDLKTIVPHCTRQISELKKEFKTIVSKIYAIDHKVGNVEHEIANSVLNDFFGKDKLEGNLHFLKIEHKELMQLLLGVKADIEQLINSEINYITN